MVVRTVDHKRGNEPKKQYKNKKTLVQFHFIKNQEHTQYPDFCLSLSLSNFEPSFLYQLWIYLFFNNVIKSEQKKVISISNLSVSLKNESLEASILEF